MNGFFVTGTDTGVGKTAVACGLLQAFKQAGYRTQAIKPVAAGCDAAPQGLRNDDALALMEVMTEPLSYAQVNPLALQAAVAPHIAAAQAGVSITTKALVAYCRALRRPDVVTLVEGAGGWRVPLNDGDTLADVARELGLPVILVVGLRLGCINHALLTAEAIAADGLVLAGWVANGIDPEMPEQEANIAALQQRLPAPLLGVLPWQPSLTADSAAKCMDISKLPDPCQRTIVR